MTREEKQKAIDALKISAPVMTVTQEEFNDYIQTLNQVMDWLDQEPPTGHWEDESPISWICSECGYQVRRYNNTDFCPHCRAKMVESQESEKV